MDELEQACLWRAEGRLQESRELLLRLARERPDEPLVHYHCAWTHDRMGLEAEAAPFYERALALGLSGEERRGAYLGLGSTYRCLGRYAESEALLAAGLAEFPGHRPLAVFRALSLYNLGRHAEAVEDLVRQLVETTGDESVAAYRQALEFYAERLDETW